MSPIKERKMTALFREYSGDFYWILNNIDTLTEKYPNKYIAVKNEQIIASDDSIKQLLTRFKKEGKNPDDYVIEFIQKGEIKYLF